MMEPDGYPEGQRREPRSEKPFSITSTRTTRAPMQNPTEGGGQAVGIPFAHRVADQPAGRRAEEHEHDPNREQRLVHCAGATLLPTGEDTDNRGHDEHTITTTMIASPRLGALV
jgi:hypothetical protein